MEPKLTRLRLIALLALTVLPSRPAFGADALIAVDVTAGGCPGRVEVTGALESRLPGVTRGRAGSGPARYRLEVNHAAGQAEAPLRLTSLAGGVVLERRLPVQANARPRELCQALAEAAALVVVRYLRDLGYRPEPEPPPPDEPRPDATAARPSPTAPAPAPGTAPAAASPPAATPPAGSPTEPTATPAQPTPPATATVRATGAAPAALAHPSSGFTGYLGAGAVVRMGLEGDPAAVTRGEVAASLQASGDRWHFELGGGVSSRTRVDVGGSTGELRLRAFPLRAAFGVPFALGGGQLLPLAGVTVDLLDFQAIGLSDARSGLRVEPAAELGVGYRRTGPRWFWRAHAAGGLSLAPRDFAADGQEPAYQTPAVYLRGLVELGPVLWKN